MALELLDQYEKVPRRSIRHDLESFFAVIIFITTRHHNSNWPSSPLARAISPNQNTAQIYNAKSYMFKNGNEFKRKILAHLSPMIPDSERFITLLEDMRSWLYPLDTDNSNDTVQDEEEVPKTCEDLSKQNMSIIDTFLGDDCGVTSLMDIEARKGLRNPYDSIDGELEDDGLGLGEFESSGVDLV